MVELCPRCASEEITDEVTGWGPKCSAEVATERYIAKRDAEIEERRRRWKQRSASGTPAALRERQHRSRLLRRTRPRERPSPFADPLGIAFECIEHLVSVRQGLKSNPRAREHLDQAEELVRQLGWGPE